MPNKNSHLNIVLILSFGFFGLTALIFQVVFAKQLVLLFGLTASAIATVLAVYFSGLAIGSFAFGKLVDKFSVEADLRGSPKQSSLRSDATGQAKRGLTPIIKLYLGLFLGTGIYGLSFPFLFPLLNKIILAINSVYHLNFSGFNFFAFLLSFLFLIFPALLIGGGFPTVNKLIIRQTEKLGRGVSFVYFVETFGNVLGAALAGFWLIPTFGNNTTIFSAASLNLIIAGVLFIFFKSQNYAEQNPIPSPSASYGAGAEQRGNIDVNPPSDPPKSASTTIGNPIFLYILFITGFLALGLEVFYTKTLILSIGSSTYAFSLILIIFLLGIALGSWFFSVISDYIKKREYAYFGTFLVLLGFWLFITARFFEKLPFWYLNIFKTYESFDFPAIFSAQLLLTFLVIFPATFLMGMIFPFGLRLGQPSINKLGTGIGKLYFANTIGGVLGSILVGFLLLPTLGYKWTFTLIILAYLFLAIFFIIKEKDFEFILKTALVLFSVFWAGLALFSSPWSKHILSLGVFPYAKTYINIDEKVFREALKSDELLFYKEGISNIAVIQRRGERLLRINGKTDASTNLGDMEAQILIGALPMLLHPDPKEVLVIGLGAGISLGSITQFDEAKTIDAVEIDPAVVEASKYFKNFNHDALTDPRVNLILADGRNYLLLNNKKYDVISSEPSNFWVSGNALLFTKEFYELAKSRLNENGIMLQWLQAYSLAPNDIKSILKTFQEVFPNTYLFDSVSTGDLFIVGIVSRDNQLDFSLIEKKFNEQKIRDELSRIYITSAEELISYLVTAGENLQEYAKEAVLHTDNLPYLEFSAVKTIYKQDPTELLKDLSALRKNFEPEKFIKTENKTLGNYFMNRQKLLPAQTALANNDLFSAIEEYKKITKEGVHNFLFETYLLQRCKIMATYAQLQGEEAVNFVWEKCGSVFEIPAEEKSAPF